MFSLIYRHPTYTWVIVHSVAAILALDTFSIKVTWCYVVCHASCFLQNVEKLVFVSSEKTMLNASIFLVGMRVSHYVPAVEPELIMI